MKLMIQKVDIGRCSLIYRTLNDLKEEIYYCLLQDINGISLYRCSQPFREYREEIFEPQSKATIKALVEFQIPKGDSQLEKDCREFIESNELIKGF